MINHNFSLENAFQDILYRIDNWINEGSGWVVELIESQFINVSTYRPLSGSSYVKLPAELRSSKKGLINIKSNDQSRFLWCHIRHTNPVKIRPERITQEDKKLANNLNYDAIGFPVREKDFSKTEKKNNICINVFCYEKKLVFPIYISDQKFENSMDLLLEINENKSHYVYIKDFYRFMLHKINIPVIFHNIRPYDSHLIFCELNKFDVKIDLIPNRLEKHITFFFKQKPNLY